MRVHVGFYVAVSVSVRHSPLVALLVERIVFLKKKQQLWVHVGFYFAVFAESSSKHN
jgi:hypothetical protein